MLCALLLAVTEDRVDTARKVAGEVVRSKVERAGLAYPPHRLYLRAFKTERELEVWGAGRTGPYFLIDTYRIAAASGKPGPKRQEGDRQVPEGFYTIDAFNPQSRFLLSMRVSYPNASDRIRGKMPYGGDIYIHGKKASIGCLAMTDPVIQEIYVLAIDTRGPRPVHLFPARLTAVRHASLVRQYPENKVFWAELKKGYDAFERTRRLPRIQILNDGSYSVR